MIEKYPAPPPELLNLWMSEDAPWDSDSFGVLTARPSQLYHIATQAARWGADQELEACCDWVSQWRCMVGGNRPEVGLRAARRLKPPSLKEQALIELCNLVDDLRRHGLGYSSDTIRRALEQLDD
jgi:hypothetical protein